MATDKNGIIIQPRHRVLIMAIVESVPDVGNGPITVKIGNGEAFGSNISVDHNHLILHPDETPVKSETLKIREAVHEIAATTISQAAGSPAVETIVVGGKIRNVGDIKVAPQIRQVP